MKAGGIIRPNIAKQSTQETYPEMRILFSIILSCLVLSAGAVYKDAGKAESLRMAGVKCYDDVQYADAIDLLTNSMKTAKRTGQNAVYCRCLNDIGYVYIRINDLDRAIYYFKKGFDMAREMGDKELQALNATSLVSAYCFHDEPATARKYFKIQRSLPRRNPYIKVYMELLNTGLIAHTEKEASLANHYYKQAVDYAQKHRIDDRLVSSVYGLMVYTALDRHDTEEARVYSSKYHEYAVAKKSPTALKTYFEMMRDISSKQGDTLSMRTFCHKIDSIDKVIIDAGQLNRVGSKLLEFENEVDKENISNLNHRINFQQVAIILFVFMTLLLAILMAILAMKDRKLRKAFMLLIKKNEEMEASEKKNKQLLEQRYGSRDIAGGKAEYSPKPSERNAIGLTKEAVDDLLNKILAVMEDTDVITKPDFNLSQLAQMVNSNTKYVSWTINDTYNKNFKSMLNEYRIREACKRLKDTEHYGNLTIQAIYKTLGYSSASNFIAAFKNVNGMTPSVYMRLARSEN